ncbi:MAG TPA: hypothetical protein VD908_07850 [Cytophagales bacterium]|nr:hypothetical protein [Cytophagales bacterium]
MEIGNSNNTVNNDKLHRLFQEYHMELDKILTGLMEKSISAREIKTIFKNVEKKKLQIRAFKRRWFF